MISQGPVAPEVVGQLPERRQVLRSVPILCLAERHGVPTELLANVRAVETLAAIAAGSA